MKLLLAAAQLDFTTWIRGLMSAAISGGASAITGGITVSGLAPDQFNFQTGKFYVLVGTLFAVNATVSIAKFLQAHPIPDLKTVEVTEQAGTPTKTVTTTTTATAPVDAEPAK